MLSRLPAGRRRGTIALAVFVTGAVIGVVAIALSQHAKAHRVVIKHVVKPASVRTPTASPPTSTVAHRSSTRPHRRPATAPRARALVTPGAPDSFASLQATLGGQIGFAVAPFGSGSVQTFGSLQSGHAWSTMKVPVLTTLLLDYEHDGQVLSAQGHADAALALEQSDNAAAEALFAVLERLHGGLVGASAAVQHTLGDAGDTTTTINTAPNSLGFTTWGQSQWSASDAVLFYRALASGCLVGPHDTAYIVGLMRNVTSSQRWGAGSAGYPSTVPLAFKAGWGPETATGGYLVRQTAIVGSEGHGYVLSMLALPAGGTFDDGVRMLTAIGSWARTHLALDAGSPPTACP